MLLSNISYMAGDGSELARAVRRPRNTRIYDCLVRYALPKRSNNSQTADISGVTVSYKVQLWHMADVQRGDKDATEYRHVALELFYLYCISHALW